MKHHYCFETKDHTGKGITFALEAENRGSNQDS